MDGVDIFKTTIFLFLDQFWFLRSYNVIYLSAPRFWQLQKFLTEVSESLRSSKTHQ